jgi:hypothetical protein
MSDSRYPEHICRDGYPDWGPPEDCPNCGLKQEFDALQGLT